MIAGYTYWEWGIREAAYGIRTRRKPRLPVLKSGRAEPRFAMSEFPGQSFQALPCPAVPIYWNQCIFSLSRYLSNVSSPVIFSNCSMPR